MLYEEIASISHQHIGTCDEWTDKLVKSANDHARLLAAIKTEQGGWSHAKRVEHADTYDVRREEATLRLLAARSRCKFTVSLLPVGLKRREGDLPCRIAGCLNLKHERVFPSVQHRRSVMLTGLVSSIEHQLCRPVRCHDCHAHVVGRGRDSVDQFDSVDSCRQVKRLAHICARTLYGGRLRRAGRCRTRQWSGAAVYGIFKSSDTRFQI